MIGMIANEDFESINCELNTLWCTHDHLFVHVYNPFIIYNTLHIVYNVYNVLYLVAYLAKRVE